MRTNWKKYFLAIAGAVAQRATCPRKSVGCVLVRDRRILSTGYNGSVPGGAHCIDEGVGCMMEHGHCVRTVHAEVNAVAQAAKAGVSIEGATAYVTITPCYTCTKILHSAGVTDLIWAEDYP